MKTDILAFGVHPDDVELSCSGTLIRHISMGKIVGIIDLTKGELGTRGSGELRMKEAAAAQKIMGVHVRECLDMKDGYFRNDTEHQKKIIEVIRKYQPEIVLCNAISDRHPDHGRASKLVSEACFYSGLIKIETFVNNAPQKHWRPKAVYHYIQDHFIHPDFVVNVTNEIEKKREAIMAYSSQFYNPGSNEPETPISSKEFLEALHAKMSVWGRATGVQFAEGFTVERYPGVENLFDLK